MACCNQLNGIEKGCDNNMGGVKKVYITPFCNITGTTESASTITVIGMASGTVFVEYAFNKNTANYVEDAAISMENGSTYHTVTTTLMIPRREAAKRTELALLAAGQQDLALIIEDGNGLFWFQGLTNGANLSAMGEGSGAAKADGSKYSLTFLSEEPAQMPEVLASLIPNLI
jgi:hypothetical protein